MLGNKSFAGFDNVDWIRDNKGEFVEVKNAYYKLEGPEDNLYYTDKNGVKHKYEGSKAGQLRYTAVDVKHLVKNFTKNNEGMYGRLDENGGQNPNDEGNFVQLLEKDGKLYYKDVNKDLVAYNGERYEGKEVGGYTMAMGENASAVSKGSTAIGYNAHALGDHSTAFGNKAISTGVHSLAFGTKTKAVGNSASAIGNYSEAYGDLSLALGDGAYAGGFKEDRNGEYILNNGIYEKFDESKNYEVGIVSTTRYSKNKTNGHETIAIGSNSMATNVHAISLGTGAHAESKNSMAYGNHSFAGKSDVDYVRTDDNRGQYGVIDGKYYLIKNGKINGKDYNGQTYSRVEIDKKDGNYTLALGTNATASNNSAISIGYNALAMGERSLALGDEALAGTKTSYEKDNSGEYYNINVSTNTGWVKKYLNKEDAIKVLVEQRGKTPAEAEVDLSKLQKYAKKYGRDTIAVGYNAHATDEEATAIGVAARAGGKASMAIGKNAIVDGTNAIGFGKNSFASGRNASAYGVASIAIGNDSLAVGTMSRVNGESGIAVGNRARVQKDKSIAIGYNSKAVKSNSIAYGTDAIASGENTIAVGSGSYAGDNYTTNVHGDYLKMSNDEYKKLGDIKDDELVYTGKDNEVKPFKNVKNDLSLLKYEKTDGSHAIAFGYNSKATALGALTYGNMAEATDENAIAVGYKAKATANNAMALGEQAEANHRESLAVGNKAKATANNTIAFGFEAEANEMNALAIGNTAQAKESKHTTKESH